MKTKKILSALLVAVYVSGLVTVPAFASNDVTKTASDVVEAMPALPTATVTKVENEDLTFALNFKADSVTDEQLVYYGDWYADYVLTVNKDVTFNADGTKDGYLAGQYDEWSDEWVKVPLEDVTLNANESLKIMEYASELLGKDGLKVTYNDVYTSVKDFDCGVFFDEEYLAANKDLEVTLELRMYNPADESESYVIGKTYNYAVSAPELPSATVTEIENEDLTFALNFKADEATDEQLAYYGDWYADYVLTVNKDVTFDANGGADGYLSGQYDEWADAWINVPFDAVTLNANEPLKIMEYASELMGKDGLKVTYNDVYTAVKDFDCGVYFSDLYLINNPDLEVILELRMYNPADESESYVIGKTYTYTAPAVEVELPSATVTKVENEDLTFALNFKADEATDEQLAYYGNWYADYVLTVNKDVTFNADGTKDGYLAGQYDEWSDEWVKVPLEDVTLNANESLKIMEYASELLGKDGLKVTYNDVYTAVKDFDCGVFFSEEYLAANPDLKVTLELRMYNPADESESYVIGETYKYVVTVPKAPTATVKEIKKEELEESGVAELTIAKKFVVEEATEEQLEYYGDWKADYFMTFDKDLTLCADGSADGYIAVDVSGEGDWVKVPETPLEVKAGEAINLLNLIIPSTYAAESGLTYAQLLETAGTLSYGVYFTDEFIEENPDVEVKVALEITNNEYSDEKVVIEDEVEVEEPVDPVKIFGQALFVRNIDSTMSDGRAAFDIVLYSGIDSLDYDEVGFELWYGKGDNFADYRQLPTYSTTTVYSAIKGKDKDGNAVKYTAADLGEGLSHIFSITCRFPMGYDGYNLVYRPYAKEYDGDKIEGQRWRIVDMYTKN